MDGWVLVLPWVLALVLWVRCAYMTTRFYRFANGHLYLASALFRVTGIRFLEAIILAVAVSRVHAPFYLGVILWLQALISIATAEITRRSGRFMYERAIASHQVRLDANLH